MFDVDILPVALIGGICLILCSLIGLSAYDGSLQRDCREKLAQHQPTRSAADITQICK